MSRENASFIKTESLRLGLENVTTVRNNVFDFLTICQERFDLIFADPPFALDGLETLPDRIFARIFWYPAIISFWSMARSTTLLRIRISSKRNVTERFTSPFSPVPDVPGARKVPTS